MSRRDRRGLLNHPDQFNQPRWPGDQQQYPIQGNWQQNDQFWQDQQSFNSSWDCGNHHQSPPAMWPGPSQPLFHQGPSPQGGRGEPTPRGFDQFQPRFLTPAPYNNVPNSQRFHDRSLHHVTQSSLEELGGNIRSRKNMLTLERGSKQNTRALRGQRGLSHAQQRSQNLKTLSKPKTFIESPNVALTNKVKETLKLFQAKKDQNPSPFPAQGSQNVSEDTPSMVVEPRTLFEDSHTRTVSNSCPNNADPSTLLEGIGFIQKSSNIQNSEKDIDESQAQTAADDPVNEDSGGNSLNISKDQVIRSIMTMDKFKRRELIEQPRSSISQYLLNHLVQENQADKARQLSTSRFRINPDEHSLYNDIETATASETDLSSLSDELLEQVKELLKEKDPPPMEEDEIQVLAPPVKEPPPCIDLDLDSAPGSPSCSLDVPLMSNVNDSGGKIEKEEAGLSVPGMWYSKSPSRPKVVEPTLTQERDATNPPSSITSVSTNPPNSEISSVPMSTNPSNSEVSPVLLNPVVPASEVSPVLSNPVVSADLPGDANSNSSGAPTSANVVSEGGPSFQTNSNSSVAPTSASVVSEGGPSFQTTSNSSGAPTSVVGVSEWGSSLQSILLDLFQDEKSALYRICDIDQIIEDLMAERKLLTLRVVEIKKKQLDAINSVPVSVQMPVQNSDQTTQVDSTDVPEAQSPCEPDNPIVEEMPLIGADASEHTESNSETTQQEPDVENAAHQLSNPKDPIHQMLSLKYRLEEIGIKVALSETVAVDSSSALLEAEASRNVSKSSSSSKSSQKRKCDSGDLVQNKKKSLLDKRPANVPVDDSLSIDSSRSPVPTAVACPTPPLAENSVAQAASISSGPEPSPLLSVTQVAPAVASPALLPPVQALPPVSLASPKPSSAVPCSPRPSPRPSVPSSPRNTPAVPTPPRHPPSIPSSPRLPRLAPSPAATPSSAAPASHPPPLIQVSAPIGGEMHCLESHSTAVKCMFASGPCLFTASEDATVHVYDLVSGQLSMRVLGHQEQVTCLYSVAMTATSKELKNVSSTSDYLHHLNLITGSKDGYIRQFSLADGNLLHEKSCKSSITCIVASKFLKCFFVGTDVGLIYSYNLEGNIFKLAPFKADSEVVCLKTIRISSTKAMIVATKRSAPTIHNLTTGKVIVCLKPNVPFSSVTCITTFNEMVYCCDSSKNLFIFNANLAEPFVNAFQMDSSAASSHYDGKAFLYLGCRDGLVRIFDCKHNVFLASTIDGPKKKTLVCMKVSNEKILFGNLAGEVAWRPLPKPDVKTDKSII